MRNETRLLYKKLQLAVANAFNIEPEDLSKKFSIDIPQETTLNDRIVESAEFLQKITTASVTDSQGQALDLGVSGLIAKRTDTDTKAREPKLLGGPDGTKWEVALTEFDVGIKYQVLDQWARYKDFYERYLNHVYQAIALNRMMIGWYGESAETETDPAANPLGQDVNVGWLKKLATQNAANFMTEGATADKIYIGAAGDYKNIDALAYDLLQAIPMHHRTGNEVVIVGSALVADNVNKGLSKHALTPSEKGMGIHMLEGTYGSLPAMQIPMFPDKGMVVTDPKNLHLYHQEGRMRRTMKDNAERDRVEDFISSNDAYAIGNVNAIAAIKAENVEFKES